MSDLPPSPERPSVKVTYMNRQKRKRKIADVADIITTQATFTSVGPTGSSMKPPPKTPASKGPKKIDFQWVCDESSAKGHEINPPVLSLPGPAPAPKRIRRDSEDIDATSHSEQLKKPTHNRSTSSISSLAHVVQKVVASSPASKKPSSVKAVKPPLSRRTATPETEMDDNASIADSVMSVSIGKIRRTETERIEYFRNQPECGTLEPHLALCTRCNKLVNLGRRQTYSVRPWETHRSKCDQRVLSTHTKGSDTHPQSEQDDEGSGALPVDPLASRRPPRKTAAERKAILDSDSRVAIVKSDEVKCQNCKKWIRLSTKLEYALANWNRHALICHDAVPSCRVATATGKLHLINDSQAKSFGVSSVICTFCDRNVDLGEGIDYDLTKWEEHKIQCHYMPPITKTSGASPDSKSGSSSTERPPPSSASTDGTLIASDPNQLSPPVSGTKRIRDDPDLPAGDADARPSNRPRSDAYIPPQKEAPGPMGWFLLPFKAFVQGFRESLKSS